MLYSPRRLEAIFGADLNKVTFDQIAGVKNNGAAREAEHLDYKREIESGDNGSDDIAIDIATFANHRGGLIVLGMDENKKTTIPIHIANLEVSDALERRIHDVAADRIRRMPRFATRQVINPASNPKKPTGFLLISIPPSPYAPHAVITPGEDPPLRWPRRHGTGKIWMSESDLEAAYRRRFTAAADQANRVIELENGALTNAYLGRFQRAIQAENPHALVPLLIVTLVPDIPGDMILDRRSVQDFQEKVSTEPFTIGTQHRLFDHVAVAHRRLITNVNAGTAHECRAELHTDGAGTFTMHPTLTPIPQQMFLEAVDAEIVVYVASALRYLARHARDRADASGAALLRVMLAVDADPAMLPPDKPMGLIHQKRFPYSIDMCTPRVGGQGLTMSNRGQMQPLAHGESVAFLDDLADDGQLLAAATAALVSDLLQAFGMAEVPQIQRDGTINPGIWGTDWSIVKAWATETNIPIAGP